MYLLTSLVSIAAAPPERTSFADTIANARKIDGYFPLYWDEHVGKMWMDVGRLDQEFLYITALSAGIGSNDLGLDRGLMNAPKVVSFRRSGPKILLIESNYAFRVSGPSAAERRAETDSFARSTLWGFQVVAEDRTDVLVDATEFFLRDAAQVGQKLQQEKQGVYRVDASRCAFELSLTKGFPRNTEIETTITLSGEGEGKLVAEVTPSPEFVTVREHQSFVQLPDAGYSPRMQDPRAGYFSVQFMDFSAPVDKPVHQHYIARHRLQKKNPTARVSDPVEPIVYYVDPGAPSEIRKALIEGASWWIQAFEAAGFTKAFQVRELPANADPMDVRYNVIQWVHRSTRGWSYGNSLVDPRTGEIIKGIVSLGSLREHQDYLIFEGLLSPHPAGPHSHQALTDAVYARLRQLAAHEVGHTLGLEHNYIASTHNRASVMDYPHPLIEIEPDGSLSLRNAYAKGIGEWDKLAITWGYSQFGSGRDDRQALDKLVSDAARTGLTFITDADSRPFGSAHPRSHLWDNGTNAADELRRILKIRQLALSRFGENNIETGAPMATLEEVLVPLYLLHRYQTEAASKMLGGNEYTYALRGDGQPITRVVDADQQRKALEALLETIDPATLTITDRILSLIPPRPPGYERTRETFASQTGLTFDPLAAAESAADLTISLILNAQRAARLIQYHAQDDRNPGLPEVIDALVDKTFSASQPTGLAAAVKARTQHLVVVRLLTLATDPSASSDARSVAHASVEKLKTKTVHLWDRKLIGEYEADPTKLTLPKPVENPPGQPIGEDNEGPF